MDKETFKKAALAIVEELVSIPDDIWDKSFPSMTVQFTNNEEVFIGIRKKEERQPVEDDSDSDDEDNPKETIK